MKVKNRFALVVESDVVIVASTVKDYLENLRKDFYPAIITVKRLK
jgi:hypothetical protein